MVDEYEIARKYKISRLMSSDSSMVDEYLPQGFSSACAERSDSSMVDEYLPQGFSSACAERSDSSMVDEYVAR